jgi:uncharacterized membrane protein YsdA (DUF1294 family)
MTIQAKKTPAGRSGRTSARRKLLMERLARELPLDPAALMTAGCVVVALGLGLLFTNKVEILALLTVNIAVFALMGIDKFQAMRGHWRIPESTLLMLAVLGGIPMILAAMALFKHKTRKYTFKMALMIIGVLQVLALMWGGWDLIS